MRSLGLALSIAKRRWSEGASMKDRKEVSVHPQLRYIVSRTVRNTLLLFKLLGSWNTDRHTD